METQTFSTAPLLRPRQVEEARAEIKTAEEKLKSPHIEDKGEVVRQLQRMRKSFEQQVPRPPASPDEEGAMVRRARALLAEIIPAMCSQEEMRKAPPGAVDKFMAGENSPAMKSKILEWKNLQLRLKPGEREAANIERHRPVMSTLNMDNAHVPGKLIFLPPADAGLPVTFSDAQLALIRAADPVLADRLGSLSNVRRADVKRVVDGDGIGLADKPPSAASIAGKRGSERREAKRKKKKRTISPEHLAKLQAGREAKLQADKQAV